MIREALDNVEGAIASSRQEISGIIQAELRKQQRQQATRDATNPTYPRRFDPQRPGSNSNTTGTFISPKRQQ